MNGLRFDLQDSTLPVYCHASRLLYHETQGIAFIHQPQFPAWVLAAMGIDKYPTRYQGTMNISHH